MAQGLRLAPASTSNITGCRRASRVAQARPMKVIAHKKSANGFSLSMVLVFTGISLMLLTGILLWGSSNGRLTARYNEFYASTRAAEAATEKVITHMARNFQQSDLTVVKVNLAGYLALI